MLRTRTPQQRWNVRPRDLPRAVAKWMSAFRDLVKKYETSEGPEQHEKATVAYTGVLLWVMYTVKKFDIAREISYETRQAQGDIDGHPKHKSVDDWIEAYNVEGTRPLPNEMQEYIEKVIPVMEDEIQLRQKYQKPDDLPWSRMETYKDHLKLVEKDRMSEGLEVFFGVLKPSFKLVFGRESSPENFDWRGMEAEPDAPPLLNDEECGGEFGRMLQTISDLWP